MVIKRYNNFMDQEGNLIKVKVLVVMLWYDDVII